MWGTKKGEKQWYWWTPLFIKRMSVYGCVVGIVGRLTMTVSSYATHQRLTIKKLNKGGASRRNRHLLPGGSKEA